MSNSIAITEDDFLENLSANQRRARLAALQPPTPRFPVPVYNKTRENERRAKRQAKEAEALARKGR